MVPAIFTIDEKSDQTQCHSEEYNSHDEKTNRLHEDHFAM